MIIGLQYVLLLIIHRSDKISQGREYHEGYHPG